MVAVRKKVGARGYIRTAPLPKGKKIFKINIDQPVQDEVFDDKMVSDFEVHFASKTKLHGKKGKLADKVKIVFDKDTNMLTLSTTMKYRKKYFKYLTKKFLKKKNMTEMLRVLAVKGKKEEYKLSYFNVGEQE